MCVVIRRCFNSMNTYTLDKLYEHGIINYTPYEVLFSAAAPNAYSMTNPYLDMAAQAGLYQRHGANPDTFSYSGSAGSGFSLNGMENSMVNPYSSLASQYKGLNSFAASNTYGNMGSMGGFGNQSIGSYSRSGLDSLGFNGSVGTNSSAALNAGFGEGGIGTSSASNMSNALGLGAAGQRISSGLSNTAQSLLSSNIFKGLIGLGILLIGGKMLFKGKKAPKNTAKTSFLSKLNPLNWFKKSNKTNKTNFHLTNK